MAIITIDTDKLNWCKMTGTQLGWVNEVDISNAIVNGTPRETVTEFADRCRECGREKVLDKIRAEIKEWYWQADKQALSKDPCVVDSMIDLFIRTIDNHKRSKM